MNLQAEESMSEGRFKEKAYSFHVDPYKYDVYVVFSNDFHASATKRKDNLPDDVSFKDTNEAAAFIRTHGKLIGYIFLPFEFTPGIVAHECLHCMYDIFVSIRVTERTDEEVDTYLLEFLVDQVYASAKMARIKP